MSRINAKIKQDQQSAAGNPGSFADLTTQLAADVSGYMKSTTATGTISVQPTPIPVADGGTGQANEQNAINGLSQVSGATNEHVLTKDTASGNAMYKAVAFDIVNDVTPQLGASLDNNGYGISDGTLNILTFGETASAVNNIKISNSATGNRPNIEAIGTDTNIGISITPKGSGGVYIGGSSSVVQPSTGNFQIGDTSDATKILAIQTSGATAGTVLTLAAVQTTSKTLTLPNATDTLVGKATTDVLTNKAITKRVVTTTDDATAVIDVTATDVYELSAVANATTFSTTGTPVDGQSLIIRFKDAGVAKGLTWDAIFVAIGVTAPTTTVAGKWHYVGCQYNSAAAKFHILAVGAQA